MTTGSQLLGSQVLGSPLFHVVLHQPEIPNNTGNIGRTCIATACALHLVRPLGFDTSDKECRRAGLDYWPRLGVREHDSLDECLHGLGRRPWLLTTRTDRCYFDAEFAPGDVLLFGKETAGLDAEILDRYPDRLLRMPMVAGERSLNLATAVCAVVYEGIRQFTRRGELSIGPGCTIGPSQGTLRP
jgi:tRNA (cytidine/uridine-2'-O-)-methyltransferase